MALAPEGETIGKILQAFFDGYPEIRGTGRPEKRPELNLGFKPGIMRRAEIWRFLESHGLAFEGMGTLPVDHLCGVVNGFIAQGKLDHLIKETLDPKDRRIQDLEARLAALEAREKPEAPKDPADRLSEMHFWDLKKECRKLGIEHPKTATGAELRELILQHVKEPASAVAAA